MKEIITIILIYLFLPNLTLGQCIVSVTGNMPVHFEEACGEYHIFANLDDDWTVSGSCGDYIFVPPIADPGNVLDVKQWRNDPSRFSLFPNPVQDQLFIEVSGQINAANVRIFDGTGQLVLERIFDSLKSQWMDISTISSGFLVCSVWAEGRLIYSQKFIKI